MATQKQKKIIEEAQIYVSQLMQERRKLYDSVKDFTLSANKTDIVLKKMADLTSSIKSNNKKILKLKGA